MEQKRMFPGALDISNADYHGDTSRISKSGLDAINKSPSHYFAKYLDPNREPQKETPALIIGKASHVAVFEPHLFAHEYAVAPNVDRRTKAGKETYEAFVAEHGHKAIISADDYETCMRMAQSVRRNPAAAAILDDMFAEQTFHFTEPETGAPGKVRPDGISAKHNLIGDLKSTEDASPFGFGRSAMKYRYHIQAPYYLDGVLAATGKQLDAFVFIAVEKTAPYAVACYYIADEDIRIGREIYLQNLATYQACIAEGRWPSYSDEVTELRLPKFKQL